MVNELEENSPSHAAAWIWSLVLMINNMGNGGSVALIIGVALALCWPGTREHPRSPPSPRWCQQVYTEQLKLMADLNPSLKRKERKENKQNQQKAEQLLAFYRPDNLWSVWRNITKNTNGKTINQINGKEGWGWVFAGAMSQQHLGPDRKQEFSQSWFDIKWLRVGGKTEFLWQFCEGQRDKNQVFAAGVWFGCAVFSWGI